MGILPKLIQTGYNFRYTATTGGNVIDEEWGIERVAAYMCIVEANRMLSQRYEKYRTYCSRIGMTLYDVEFLDSATKVDLNTLINKFLPEVLDTDNDNIKYLGMPLNTALDALEAKVKDLIVDEESPIEAFGQIYTPDKLLTRPTAEEYSEIVAKKAEKEAKFRKELNEQIAEGVVGKKVTVICNDHECECRVTKESDKYLYLTVYDDGGAVIQTDMRVPKTSKKFVTKFH